MHGKTSAIHHDGRTIFSGLPQDFEATRYHSLVVFENTVPKELEISARTSDGVIMGLRHRRYKSGRRPVPPGVDPHQAGQAVAAQLPKFVIVLC